MPAHQIRATRPERGVGKRWRRRQVSHGLGHMYSWGSNSFVHVYASGSSRYGEDFQEFFSIQTIAGIQPQLT